jgi:hypothetical protein
VYVVQSTVSANLAVTAVLAWLFLDALLLWADWFWIGSVSCPLIATTAAVVAAETVAPALSRALLGDRPRPGWAPVAVAGIAMVLTGAVRLAGPEPRWR